MYHSTHHKLHTPSLFANINICVRTWFSAILFAALFIGCSSEKFLHEGESVLSDIKLETDSKHIKTGTYRGFVRQEPNAKWFTLVKVPLGIYCMSKADSIKGNKGFSKVLKNIGEAPVIYDSVIVIL